MSLNLNKVILAGNLTKDPEVRIVGKSTVANFGLAINRKFKSGDEKREESTFVDVECWGTTAELVGQYLTKGRGAFIEGRLKLDQWDDKATGQKRSKLKVVADTVQFLSDGKRHEKGDNEPVIIEDDEPPKMAVQKPAVASWKKTNTGDEDQVPF